LVLAWLKREGETEASLADKIGVNRAVLWKWLHDGRSPRVDFAVRLQEKTGVPASAWRPVRAKRKAA